MRLRRLTGFTLVELLVVIAIIGVLIALLLPAVQAAREAARRTECVNHLKQLGLAVQNHTDAKKALPNGKTVVASTACTPSDYSNWAIEILPYLEEQALYDLYRFDRQNVDPLNNAVYQKVIAGMVCPSDPNNSRVGTPANAPAGFASTEFATGSYKGVSGRGYFTTTGSSADAAFFDNTRLPMTTVLSVRDRGPLFTVITNGVNCKLANMHRRPIKLKQITDGTSKTLLIGEYTTLSEISRSAFWANSYYGMNLGSIALPIDCASNPNCDASSTSISLDPDFKVCEAGMSNRRDSCSRTFAGLHGGGGSINFAHCDGSVQQVATEIDMKILANMATTSGDDTPF